MERRDTPPPQKKPAPREDKQQNREKRKLQNRVDYLEKEIGKRESRMGAIEGILAAPGGQDDIMELTR